MPPLKRVAPRSRQQDERPIRYHQKSWKGELRSDQPASTISKTAVSSLKNFANYGWGLEGRGGNMLWSATALSGAGTAWGWHYHEKQDRIIVQRGAVLYETDALTISYNVVAPINGTLGDSESTFDERGDNVIVFNASGIFKVDLSVDPALYYMVNSPVPTTRIVDANSQAASTKYGRGYIYTVLKLAGSGIRNRRSATIDAETGGCSTDSEGRDWGEVWRSFAYGTGTAPSVGLLVKPTNADHMTHYGVFCTLDLGTDGYDPKTGAKNNTEEYINSYDIPIATAVTASVDVNGTMTITIGSLEETDRQCRIYDVNGTYWEIVSVSNGGQTATLFEAGGGVYSSGVLTSQSFGLGRPATGDVLTLSQSGTTVTKSVGNNFVAGDVGKPLFIAEHVVTWIKTYTSTTQVEVTDSASRSSRAAVIDPVSRDFADSVTDDTLRGRITTDSLQQRLWTPLPSTTRGKITPTMVFVATVNDDIVYYQGIPSNYDQLLGQHYLAEQRATIKGAIQGFVELPDMIIVLCSTSTHAFDLNSLISYQIPNTAAFVTLLGGYRVLDHRIGTKAIRSVAFVAHGRFALITSEPGVRICNGYKYSVNVADDRILDILRKLDPNKVVGSYDDENGYQFWTYQTY